MKKILLILLLTIPFIGFGQNVKFDNELIHEGKMYYFEGSPFNGMKISQYTSGGSSIFTMKNGLPNGLYQSFYSNGKLNWMGNYINGFNRDGMWKRWYENGQLWSIMIYDGVNGDISTVTTNGLISIQCWDEDGNEISCE